MTLLLFIIILGLGTARVTALISRDGILAGPRHLIFTLFPPEDNARLGWNYQKLLKATAEESAGGFTIGERWPFNRYIEVDEEARPPSFVGELIGCPMCISVWIGVLNYAAYTQWPETVWVINEVLAITWIGAVATVRGGWR